MIYSSKKNVKGGLKGMKVLKHLFDKNLEWAAAIKGEDPEFFSELSNYLEINRMLH